MHRFFGEFDFKEKLASIDDANLVSQIRNVLRLKKGDMVLLSNGTTKEARATIVDSTKDQVGFEIETILENEREPDCHVILYLALLKSDHFDLVVQKATEIGVREIIPLITERTVKFGLRDERLKKIIREAAEQSGRAVLPKLNEPMDFPAALEHAKQNDKNYFFDIDGQRFGGRGAARQVGIFIGPEGGWTDNEREHSSEGKHEHVTLGKLTLRAETAAIVSSYLVINT